jgi:hypothetical protein
MEELRRIFDGLTELLNNQLKEALAPTGTPGDAKAIAFVVRQIGAAYRHALEWSQRVRRAHLVEHFSSVASEMALFIDPLIQEIEGFGPYILKQLDDALSAPPDQRLRSLDLTLHMALPSLERFDELLERAKAEYL